MIENEPNNNQYSDYYFIEVILLCLLGFNRKLSRAACFGPRSMGGINIVRMEYVHRLIPLSMDINKPHG